MHHEQDLGTVAKSVLVVGAGPAGLVAAKSLLESNKAMETFKVTVFDSADRIGGMWRAGADETGEKCSPEMRTNLSRFTVTFPDFAWQSVDLDETKSLGKAASECRSTQCVLPPFLRTSVLSPTGTIGFANTDSESSISLSTSSSSSAQGIVPQLEAPDAAHMFSDSIPETCPPLFPKAFEVGRYLQAYARKFIPSDVIHLNRRVAAANLITRPNNPPQWTVTSLNCETGQEFTDVFDYLIVASGFFGSPVPSLQTSLPTQHSSKFEDVSLFGDKSGNIVVVGGGISGAEAAATAAMQISSARHSPGQKPAWSGSVVQHVFDRPFHTLPRFLAYDSFQFTSEGEVHFKKAPRYLPLDLVLYDMAHKGNDRISASNGLVSPEKATKGQMFINLLAGGGKDRRPEYVSKEEEQQYPPRVCITDTYSEFVRSGLIVPVRGRVTATGTNATSQASFVEVLSKDEWAHSDPEVSTSISFRIMSVDQNNRNLKGLTM